MLRNDNTGDGAEPETKKQKTETFEFGLLPDEMQHKVSGFFDFHDYRSGTHVNKQLYRLFHGPDFWLKEIKRHFPHRYGELRREKNLNWAVIFQDLENEEYRHLNTDDRLLFRQMKADETAVIIQRNLKFEDLTKRDESGRSLYSWAARNGNQQLLNFFYGLAVNHFTRPDLQNRLIPNIPDMNGNTLLHWAIRCRQSILIIAELIGLGWSVNAVSDEGITPLYLAAQEGHHDCCFQLITASEVSANQPSGFLQETPLIAAARLGSTRCVKLLLDAGADVHKTSTSGATAIATAATCGQVDCLELLLASGANPNQTYRGISALYLAVQERRSDCMYVLLKAGADANLACTDDGDTPLMSAAANGDAASIRSLLASGANVHQTNTLGITALHCAAKSGDLECVQLLLDKGALVNQARNNGVTALYVAAENQRIACMELLLNRGAEVNLQRRNGGTPLIIAAVKGDAAGVDLLLKRGAHVNHVRNDGTTALYFAAGNGYADCMQLLLAAGANTELAFQKDGCTPLVIAARNGQQICTKILLDAGANVSHVCMDQRTALHDATLSGSKVCVRLLLDRGADIEARFECNRESLLALSRKYHPNHQVNIDYFIQQQRFNPEKFYMTPELIAELLGYHQIADILSAARQEKTKYMRF